MWPDDEKAAENTCRIVKDFEEVWTHFCPPKPCLPLPTDGKMGEKYRARYLRHFAHPIIHEQDMQHEELLACHPEEWARLVKSIALHG